MHVEARGIVTLELESQAVVGRLTWVLGADLSLLQEQQELLATESSPAVVF